MDYGYVGDVERVDAGLLADLIGRGVVPVMAPLTHDGSGHLLNTNADTIAGETAKALAPHFDVTLVFCFEKAGVIPHIDAASFARLREEGIVSGGMIPKLENAFAALREGVRRVVITRASAIANPGAGTIVEL